MRVEPSSEMVSNIEFAYKYALEECLTNAKNSLEQVEYFVGKFLETLLEESFDQIDQLAKEWEY